MKRSIKALLKNILIFILSFIFLFFLVLILVAFLVDINQYKNEIEQLVEDETSLKLEINGPIRLSFFSGIKFSTSDVTLSHDNNLIADIDSLRFGVSFTDISLASFLRGKPKITSAELRIKTLNLSRDKDGFYNFLPLLENSILINIEELNKDNKDNTELNDLLISHFFIEDIKLSINHLNYLDDLEALSIKLKKIKASLSLLPVIDHNELVINDPQIITKYTYSGNLSIKQALLNQYQIANLSLMFKEQQGEFSAEEVKFSFIQEGKDHALPPLVFDAYGQVSFSFVYTDSGTNSELLWTQPQSIKLGKFDFNLPELKVSNEQVELETKSAHLKFENVYIFKNSQYAMSELLIKSLLFESNEIDLIWKKAGKDKSNWNKEEYHFKKFLLQTENLPILSKGKPFDVTSEAFLKQFAQKGRIEFSSESLSDKTIGLNNIKFVLQGNNNEINLKMFSFNTPSSSSFNDEHSQVTGKALIRLSKEPALLPQWEFSLHSKKVNLESIVELMNLENKIQGYAFVDSQLSGFIENSNYKILSGRIHAKASDLLINHMDVDKILEDLQSSQSVGLLDIGAVGLLGPAGILVTKGNDYRNLSNSFANKGNSKIKQFNSDISYANDIATLNDVAFATQKYRLAAKGKINLQEQTFLQFFISTVDENGCSIYEEEIKGRLSAPSVKKINVLLGGVINPINSVVSKTKDTLNLHCKTPFYNGIVKAP
jgi:hypothetical protein